MAGYIAKVTIGENTYPVASTLYGTSSTAIGTATKAVTCSDFDAFQTGVIIAVKFTNGNSAAAVKLNINSKGEKSVYVNGAASTVDNFSLAAGAVALFAYDGTQFHAIGVDTDTKVRSTSVSNNKNYPLMLAGWDVTSGVPAEAYYNANVKLNASTGDLTVGKISTDGSNFYEIGAAAEKGIGTVTSGNTGLVTGGDVAEAIAQSASGGVAYQGAIDNTSAGNNYWQTKMLNVALTAGWYYVATASFSIDDINLESGDMVFVSTAGTYATAAALADAIDAVQVNIETMTTSDIDNAVANA